MSGYPYGTWPGGMSGRCCGDRPAGQQIVIWDGRRDGGDLVAGGGYLVELNGGGWRRTTRVIVLP